MGMEMIIAIMFIELILLVLAVVLAVIDWPKRLRERFGNNPNRAKVYIEVGEELYPVDAKKIGVHKKGELFGYKWGGAKHQVIIPANYPVIYVEGRRLVAVKNGRLIASTLKGKPGLKFTEADITSIEERQVIVDLVMRLTKGGIPMWVWIAGGVAILVMGFMLLRGCGGDEAVPPGEIPINPETGEPFASLMLWLGV